ncbi:MAG: hypothetical protein AAFZ07_22705 [Actinomycetota bacterium]
MHRLAAAALALVLVAAACGGDGDDETSADTSPPTSAAPTTAATTSAPATTAAPEPAATEPPATTAATTTAPSTTTSTTTAPTPTIALPDVTTIVGETELGAGFVLGASLAAPVVWIAAPVDGTDVVGCEGLPAETLWAQATDGSTREAALPEDPDLVGVSDVRPLLDGRVLLIRACEGFLVDAWLGTDDGTGVVRDVEQLELSDSAVFSTIRVGSDRVTFVEGDPFGATGGSLIELDLASGARNVLVDGDIRDAVALSTGNLVYRTSTELFVSGFSLGTFPETGPFSFTFEPDLGNENVAVSLADGLAVYVGSEDELIAVLAEDVAVLDWHPSGEAVLVNGPFDAEEPAPPRIVLLDGTTVPLPVTADVVNGAFTGDGLAVVMSTFADDGEIVTTAYAFAG